MGSVFQADVAEAILSLSSDVTTITSDLNVVQFVPSGGWILLPLRVANSGIVVIDPLEFPLRSTLNPWGLPAGAQIVSPLVTGLSIAPASPTSNRQIIISGTEPVQINTVPGPAYLTIAGSGPPGSSSVTILESPASGAGAVGALGAARLASAGVPLGSKPVRLGAVRSRRNGHFSLTVRIAPQTTPGRYELYAVGTASHRRPSLLGTSIVVIGRPVVSKLTQSHRRWREGKTRRPGRKTSGSPATGTIFSFNLNESARITLAFTRNGRDLAALTRIGRPGANNLSFDGRISRRQELGPGGYTLTITATNIGGRSPARRLHFTILP